MDNHVANLEWVTSSENRLHAFVTGLKVPTSGERNGHAKLKWVDILAIRAARGQITQRELGEIYGVCDATISQIQTGRRRIKD